MNPRRFALIGTFIFVLASGCLGSKSGTTVTVVPGSADRLELVDWGKSDKMLRLKLKNKSNEKIPGGSETLFVKWYGKNGSGNTDRIMNFHLQPGASEKYEIEHTDMDNVDKVEIGIADPRK